MIKKLIQGLAVAIALTAAFSGAAQAQFISGVGCPRSGCVFSGPIGAPGETLTGPIFIYNSASFLPSTSSGISIGGAGNISSIVYANSLNAAGGRLAYSRWDNSYTLTVAGFASDNFSTLLPAIQVQGTQGLGGITGITSNSGSGVWNHNGGMTVYGNISTTLAGATVSASGIVAGSGGITVTGPTTLNGNTSITGTLSVSGIMQAGSGTVNVYTAAGNTVTTPHMVTGTVTLASGAGTATLTGSAVYSATTSYNCMATDTTSNSAVKATPASASSVSFSGATSDVIAYQCLGN